MANTAGILIIGDEILAGTFRDENAQFLIPELRQRGIRLQRIEFIRDRVEEIAESVRRLASTCTWVFTSGGVGATHDDVTIPGLASAFEVDIVRDPELEQMIWNHYGERTSADHLRLADVPCGSTLAFDDDRRWPVIRFRNLYILPGVPSLFRRCFGIIASELSGTPAIVARAYCGGDETDLAGPLTRLARTHSDVSIGSYPRIEATDYNVLITIEGSQGQPVATALQALRDALGELIVRIEGPDAQSGPTSPEN